MKTCVIFVYDGWYLKLKDISLVNDDHNFGWIKEELHFEGEVSVNHDKA